MKLKNIKTILFSSIVIFILCSLFHFGYTFLPHFITSIFFPVNESIFEHLKMLATAEVVFSLYVIFRKDKENGFLKMLLRIILSIFILLLFSWFRYRCYFFYFRHDFSHFEHVLFTKVTPLI